MSAVQIAKNLGINYNVVIRVLDAYTHEVVSEHIGHNSATNSMLTGIGHYLVGDGIWNQGYTMLSEYVPRYISLGTMGLINQEADSSGYPAGLGTISYAGKTYAELSAEDLAILGKSASSAEITAQDEETLRFMDYMVQRPGFGADGYDLNLNNGRTWFGLGPTFADRKYRSEGLSVDCELISESFPRSEISFRDIVPEVESEIPGTLDIVFSAMISTGALAQFREPGKDHIFITEAGLWSQLEWNNSGANGLLAGYRIAPTSSKYWDMRDATNRALLKKSIIRVNKNQIVQVIWKLQLGSVDQFGGVDVIYSGQAKKYWHELG